MSGQAAFQQAINMNRKPDTKNPGCMLGKVIATHPESNSVDVEWLEGGIIRNVQVLSCLAGTDFGYADLGAEPELVKGEIVANDGVQDSPVPSKKRDIYAVVGYIGSFTNPFVFGFLYPEVAQCLFQDRRMVYRHHSDFYYTIDKDANFEMVHPSGVWIRIGQSPTHEDLEGKDYDAKWKIKKNTDKESNMYIRFKHPNLDLTIPPKGDAPTIVIEDGGAVMQVKKGDVTVTASDGSITTNSKNATVNASVKIVANAPLIELAGGDQPVARKNDPVIIDVFAATAGGDPVIGSATGYISNGSTKVKSG